eukprot:2033231-Lingulodinium_polyedra.AAC.1
MDHLHNVAGGRSLHLGIGAAAPWALQGPGRRGRGSACTGGRAACGRELDLPLGQSSREVGPNACRGREPRHRGPGHCGS